MSQIAFMTAKTKTLVANTTISAMTGVNALIAVTTSANHLLETGDIVQISGVASPAGAANGQWVITKTGATTFTLNNSLGSGTWVSGGTVVHLGFASAAVLVDNTVFTTAPDFTLKFSAESLASGAGVRAVFTDASDAAFVTEQPTAVFVAPGQLFLSNGKKYSAKKEDVFNALTAASGDNMRLKLFISGGVGATGQFSAWIEY